MTPQTAVTKALPAGTSEQRRNSYAETVAACTTYTANALSVVIDADKIAVFRAELSRRGVRQEEIEPMFLRALDEGEFTFFPSVDQLLAFRPKRKALPPAPMTPEERADAEAGYRELKGEIDRICGPGTVEKLVETHSMPGPAGTRATKTHDEQKAELAQWAKEQGIAFEWRGRPKARKAKRQEARGKR